VNKRHDASRAPLGIADLQYAARSVAHDCFIGLKTSPPWATTSALTAQSPAMTAQQKRMARVSMGKPFVAPLIHHGSILWNKENCGRYLISRKFTSGAIEFKFKRGSILLFLSARSSSDALTSRGRSHKRHMGKLYSKLRRSQQGPQNTLKKIGNSQLFALQ
jgi:hypothetical protein